MKSYLHCGTQHQSNQTVIMCVIQHVFLVVNFFLQLDFINAIDHTLTCQICILGSVVRALRFMSFCQFQSKRCAFALRLVAKARQYFLNLRNPNHLFPSAIIDRRRATASDCLLEAKSFLHIDCSNESSFAKTIYLFINPDACRFEMRLQNG